MEHNVGGSNRNVVVAKRKHQRASSVFLAGEKYERKPTYLILSYISLLDEAL